MFKQITINNFRTHADTTIQIEAITLLIGPNNAGKSNLFSGIRHFSRLVARARPHSQKLIESKNKNIDKTDSSDVPTIRSTDFFPHRHRLASDDDPMLFSCLWENKFGNVEYQIELYENQKLRENVGCREKIKFSTRKYNDTKEVSTGFDKSIDILELRTKIESENLKDCESSKDLDNSNRLAKLRFRISSYP